MTGNHLHEAAGHLAPPYGSRPRESPASPGPYPGSCTCPCRARCGGAEEDAGLVNNSAGAGRSPGAASPWRAGHPSSFASLPRFPLVQDGDVLPACGARSPLLRPSEKGAGARTAWQQTRLSLAVRHAEFLVLRHQSEAASCAPTGPAGRGAATALELFPHSFRFPRLAVKSDVSKSLFSSFSGMGLISEVLCG